jgi:hypothetical protein
MHAVNDCVGTCHLICVSLPLFQKGDKGGIFTWGMWPVGDSYLELKGHPYLPLLIQNQTPGAKIKCF